jgi:plastocyanin domain-containing protein
VPERQSPTAISTPAIEYETQVIRVTQKAGGYFPSSLTVRRGVPVRLIVTSETAYSCAASLVMPTLGISRDLHRGENVLEFTPTAVGTIPFSCAMGMYRGVINVL